MVYSSTEALEGEVLMVSSDIDFLVELAFEWDK